MQKLQNLRQAASVDARSLSTVDYKIYLSVGDATQC